VPNVPESAQIAQKTEELLASGTANPPPHIRPASQAPLALLAGLPAPVGPVVRGQRNSSMDPLHQYRPCPCRSSPRVERNLTKQNITSYFNCNSQTCRNLNTRVCFGRKPGIGKTEAFSKNLFPSFLSFYLSKSFYSKYRQPMAICCRLPTFPDWPCDGLERLHLGDKIGNKATSLYGRSGRHGGSHVFVMRGSERLWYPSVR